MLIFNNQNHTLIEFNSPIIHKKGIKQVIVYNDNKIECILYNNIKIDYSLISTYEDNEIKKIIGEEIETITNQIYYRKKELNETYKMIENGDIYNEIIIDIDHFTPDDYVTELKNDIDNNNKKLKALSIILNKQKDN